VVGRGAYLGEAIQFEWLFLWGKLGGISPLQLCLPYHQSSQEQLSFSRVFGKPSAAEGPHAGPERKPKGSELACLWQGRIFLNRHRCKL